MLYPRVSRRPSVRRRLTVLPVKLTIIIPAFNEAAYLGATLDSIEDAAAHLRAGSDAETDVIVVDNNSTDETAPIARSKGATVVHEPVQGIARARNTGVRHAEGDVLVFVDADVTAPPTLLDAIHAAMTDPACAGGGVDVEYRPQRLAVRLHLRAWRLLGPADGNGPRPHAVLPQVGLRTSRGLRRAGHGSARTSTSIGASSGPSRGPVARSRFIRNPRVRPSCRRFDTWPVWKVQIWTNPLFIALFRRLGRVVHDAPYRRGGPAQPGTARQETPPCVNHVPAHL